MPTRTAVSFAKVPADQPVVGPEDDGPTLPPPRSRTRPWTGRGVATPTLSRLRPAPHRGARGTCAIDRRKDSPQRGPSNPSAAATVRVRPSGGSGSWTDATFSGC
ncbi:MAG: hypothetical protein AVDCRST_MAG19-4280 [uncultured Thermomicrobiales bacterium]|uniref:Uncharacterized protein n=1 Tax=uncultured Thermomicrobiales bacterium TaxID=1645740 RepID=A0A6J4VQK4_9BACT|nr:MAG: hypothetical protein AVDCRST_MAG19-4280 [uncultured Thermomicrobiales bacterium]